MKHIWVDADACPKIIKDIIFKAALRTQTQTILVANTSIVHPNSPYIKAVRVEKGFDSADRYIVTHVTAQDLVITADIPLAAELIEKHAAVISPRGEVFTPNDMKQRLTLRDMNEQIRSFGGQTKGPCVLGIKEKTYFANALDRWLAKKA